MATLYALTLHSLTSLSDYLSLYSLLLPPSPFSIVSRRYCVPSSRVAIDAWVRSMAVEIAPRRINTGGAQHAIEPSSSPSLHTCAAAGLSP